MIKKMIFILSFLVAVIVFIVPGYTLEIHDATKKGELIKVKEMISANPDLLNSKDRYGRTPLHWAVRKDSLDIVKFLVKSGADVNAKDRSDNIPLYYSVWWGKIYEITEYLVNKGSNINFKSSNGTSLLFLASSLGKEKITKLLVEKGADPNQQNIVGKTPLYISVENKYTNIVELLLKNNANISINDNFGRTPFHQVAIEGYRKIAELLLESGTNINDKDDLGKTPLYYAGKYGHNKLADFLKSRGGKTDEVIENFGYSSLIKKKLKEKEAIIWYLGHAGWAVKTKRRLLIFDYWERGKSDEPLLVNGRINPEEIKDLDVYVFISHSHYDHYDEVIFEWKDVVDKITFIFGWQNDKEKGHIFLSPREKKKIGSMEVFLVNSPKADPFDNAFLVKVDGITVYHAGDYGALGGIEEITPVYKEDMNYLKKNADGLDIMFLFGGMIKGKLPRFITFSIETVNPSIFFPMHQGSREYLFRELRDKIVKVGNNIKIITPENRGDMHIYQSGK